MGPLPDKPAAPETGFPRRTTAEPHICEARNRDVELRGSVHGPRAGQDRPRDTGLAFQRVRQCRTFVMRKGTPIPILRLMRERRLAWLWPVRLSTRLLICAVATIPTRGAEPALLEV